MFKLGDTVKTFCPKDKEWHDLIGTIEAIDRESDFPYRLRLSNHAIPIGYKEKELINLSRTVKITIRRKGGVSNETETS